ncbi:MAG: hypothetical protein IAE63_05895 [Alphaproteobacteria bacterium]|nr:hypothetical protein [Alphaproteobacteria bacterium]
MDIDISYLEMNSGFRSDELYFIRLAGGYIRSIFWDVFLSNNKNRPKKLYQLISDEFSADTYSFLREQIVPDPNNNGRRKGQLDCISGKFKTLLEKMPDEMVEAFENVLKLNYGVFIRFKDDKGNQRVLTFIKLVECLYRRRNYLEHFEDDRGKKRKNYNKRRDDQEFVYEDETFIESLGLLLLPELLHKFSGRVASYESKQGSCTDNANWIRQKGALIIKERRQNTYRLFSVERSRQSHKNKTKRKHLVDPNIAWRVAYRKLTHKETDYKEHEFKVRYYFIGKTYIDKIRSYIFSQKESEPVHFKRDIEAFYILTCEVNLVLHRCLEEMKVGGKVVGGHHDETVFLRDLRNKIAHGGFFWDVSKENLEILSVSDIFEGMLSACRNILGKERANNLFVQLERLLRKENFSIVDISSVPPKYLHIQNWSIKNRQKYIETSDETVGVDMHRSYRRVVGKWMTSLLNAKHVVGLDKKQKKCQI